MGESASLPHKIYFVERYKKMTQINTELITAMNSGKPVRSYIKTILGKVFVTVWDPFTNTPTGLILSGDPKKREESSIIDMFTELQDSFFRRMNRRQLETGVVIPYTRVEEAKERTIEESTDEELETLVNQKFLALQSTLNKVNSEPVLFRMLQIARDLEKSEKIIRAIEARLSEIQTHQEAAKE